MATELGDRLAAERGRLHWSLREVERRTGIRNAHLIQIEKGTIERPDPNILWTLASAYGVDFGELMRLAGHVDGSESSSPVIGVALRAFAGLTPQQQHEALEYMAQMKRESKREQPHDQ